MMTVIEIFLVAVVATLFILMAITPMIAEARPNGRVRRAGIVPITLPTHVHGRGDTHQADAA